MELLVAVLVLCGALALLGFSFGDMGSAWAVNAKSRTAPLVAWLSAAATATQRRRVIIRGAELQRLRQRTLVAPGETPML